MILDGKTYVPTLAVRPSEMDGLERLPGATKNRMVPCFLLAPWVSSHSLERTIDRIERAFLNRSYFLDIDGYYKSTNPERQVQQELDNLKNPTDNFANWVAFSKNHERVWPCIQTKEQTERQMRGQIEEIQKCNRPYCMRIVRNRRYENIQEIMRAFISSGYSDFAVILEGGWDDDHDSLTDWFNSMISNHISQIDARVPVVLSFTSFPKEFTEYNSDKLTPEPFSNRQLVDEMAGQLRHMTFIYGDWGSTRPREPGGFKNRPLPRIDYPTDRAWQISRNGGNHWGFHDAAQNIIKSPEWSGGLGVWGEDMIRNTVTSIKWGINTAAKNVAARVNIHLHRQAFFDALPNDPDTFDEVWED